jgi:hypothetical protein
MALDPSPQIKGMNTENNSAEASINSSQTLEFVDHVNLVLNY